jgi:hypothetical protein
MMVWSILKLIHVYCLQEPVSQMTNGKRPVNLSVISMYLNCFGNTIHFSLRCIKQAQVTMDYATPEPIGTQVAVVILNSVSIACWIASLAIIMGFWIDALHSKLRIKMAARTKVLCIVAAFLVLVMIPGMLMATALGMFVVGVTIIIIPYIIDTTIFVIVVTILRTGCCIPPGTPALSESNRKKAAYVYRYMTVATVAWTFITVFGGLGGIIAGMPHFATISTFLTLIATIAEAVAVWATMMLVERKIGLRVLLHDVFTWSHNSTSLSKSTQDKSTSTDKKKTTELSAPGSSTISSHPSVVMGSMTISSTTTSNAMESSATTLNDSNV